MPRPVEIDFEATLDDLDEQLRPQRPGVYTTADRAAWWERIAQHPLAPPEAAKLAELARAAVNDGAS